MKNRKNIEGKVPWKKLRTAEVMKMLKILAMTPSSKIPKIDPSP